MKRSIAVIPARGGSKRIPRKNIKLFAGKPMIGWSIEAAQESGCFDRVVVSTDDDEIADVAIQFGAEVPFMRPRDLADDYTGTIPVVKHAIEQLDVELFDVACCIYATAPFIKAQDLIAGWELIKNGGINYAFTVASYAFPIQRALKIKNGRVRMFEPENFCVRSQDLEDAFHDAGQFYWGTVEAWLRGDIFFGPQSAPILLPRHRVQDIDTPEDWRRAELLQKVLQQELRN